MPFVLPPLYSTTKTRWDLGTFKLLGAGGVWLGPYYVLIALSLGATAGIIHGLGVAMHEKKKTGKPVALGSLSLPAGAGVCGRDHTGGNLYV